MTLALATLLAAWPAAQTRYFTRADLHAAVDELNAVDLDGRVWNRTVMRGQVVLLDFWASWCAPCLDELPNLREVRRAFGAQGFEIVGISLNSSSRRDLVAWLNRHAIDWPQIHEGRAFNAPVARTFGVRALPASILLDADGNVAATNLRGEQLRRAVQSLVYRRSTSSFDAARMPIVRR